MRGVNMFNKINKLTDCISRDVCEQRQNPQKEKQGLSSQLHDEWEKISKMSRPRNLGVEVWRKIQENMGRLAKNQFKILKDLSEFGYNKYDIFGCDLIAPTDVFFRMGLIMLLARNHNAKYKISVKKEYINIKKLNGNETTFRGCFGVNTTISQLDLG